MASCNSYTSYAVTYTAKCGVEIIFSRVSCIDLNHDFQSLFDAQTTDGIILERVEVSAGPNGPWHVVGMGESMTVLQALGFRHIMFVCFKQQNTPKPPQRSAFEVLMGAAREKVMPTHKQEKTKKDKMFNDICVFLKDAGLGFSSSVANSEGSYVVQVCSNF